MDRRQRLQILTAAATSVLVTISIHYLWWRKTSRDMQNLREKAKKLEAEVKTLRQRNTGDSTVADSVDEKMTTQSLPIINGGVLALARSDDEEFYEFSEI